MSDTSPLRPIESWEVLDLLASLVQKSLVVFEEDEQGQGRYRLLEPMRQYARHRLSEAGEGGAVRTRHLEFFLHWAEQGPGLARLEAEHDNLWAALGGAGAGGRCETGLQLGGALRRFWNVRGYWTEGREHLAQLLAPGASGAGAEIRTTARAKALLGAGWLAWQQGDLVAARALEEESLSIYREAKDERGIADSLLDLGWTAHDQGDLDAARSRFEESLALYRVLGVENGIASSLYGLGWMAHHREELEAARTLFEQSLAIFQRLGDRRSIAELQSGLGCVAHARREFGAAWACWEESLAIYRELGHKSAIAWSLIQLGASARDQGEYGRARALWEESLAICRELGSKGGIAANLEGFATMAVARGASEHAARLFGAAEGLREAIGAPLLPADRTAHDRSVALLRGALGAEAFAAAWADGKAMAPDAAVDYALEGGCG